MVRGDYLTDASLKEKEDVCQVHRTHAGSPRNNRQESSTLDRC